MPNRVRCMSNESKPLIEVENLTKYYQAGGGMIDTLLGRVQQVKAVDGVDFELYPGETLGVVGESGCGKTTLGRSMLRLIEPTDGSIVYRKKEEDGTVREIELTDLSSSELRNLRRDIQYIFQDPFSSLNPRMTVGDIIGEPLDIHDIAHGDDRNRRIEELLDIVGLNRSHAYRYPHEFSGGQRQRIGIARALAVDPEIIVCDEPVSALDVSVQAQILNLLEDLQDEFDLSYIFIAHDLSVVEHISDRVAVMYLGEIAEVGSSEELFRSPKHPYTEALLSVIPEPDPQWVGNKILLEGDVPSPLNPPTGCRFHTRCHRIIPAERIDIDQETFRSVMNLKIFGRDAESTAELVTLGSGDIEFQDMNLERASELDDALREAYELPTTLEDSEAEAVLTDAIDNLAKDGPLALSERLDDLFISPCETNNPELNTVEGTQEVQCLLYTDEFRSERVDTDLQSQTDAPADD